MRVRQVCGVAARPNPPHPRIRQHSLRSFKAEPSPHSGAAKLAHPPPRLVCPQCTPARRTIRRRRRAASRPTSPSPHISTSRYHHLWHPPLSAPPPPSPPLTLTFTLAPLPSPSPRPPNPSPALPCPTTPPPSPLYCPFPPSLYPRAAVEDTARTDGRAHGSGRRAAEDSLRPPRQHEVPGRAGGDQARTHREYRS